MEGKARIIWDTKTKKVTHVVSYNHNGIVLFNMEEDDFNNQFIGSASSVRPILIAQGYDVTALDTYMMSNNIPIPE